MTISREQLQKVAEEMKRGVLGLQKDLSSGNTAAVATGLEEFLASLEELSKALGPAPGDAA